MVSGASTGAAVVGWRSTFYGGARLRCEIIKWSFGINRVHKFVYEVSAVALANALSNRVKSKSLRILKNINKHQVVG